MENYRIQMVYYRIQIEKSYNWTEYLYNTDGYLYNANGKDRIIQRLTCHSTDLPPSWWAGI